MSNCLSFYFTTALQVYKQTVQYVMANNNDDGNKGNEPRVFSHLLNVYLK